MSLTLEEVRRKIRELDPWYCPAVVGGVQVTAGVGSTWQHKDLLDRYTYRQQMLVDEVCRRYNFGGKSVLDVACNCGYWPARYAERGATRICGVEGRARVLAQAKLYWSTNNYLPEKQWTFVLGDVSKSATWLQPALDKQVFDVTLCAGILYHIPNYKDVIIWMARVTADIMIVDTRVTHGPEVPVAEKEDLHFNGVDVVTPKVVPNLNSLLGALRSAGFQTDVLVPPGKTPHGLAGPDDYQKSNRVCIFARRVK